MSGRPVKQTKTAAGSKRRAVGRSVDPLVSGDLRLGLEAARDILAKQLRACEDDPKGLAVVAQVSAQYRQMAEAIAALPAPEGVSKLDELRAKRRPGTASEGRAGRAG